MSGSTYLRYSCSYVFTRLPCVTIYEQLSMLHLFTLLLFDWDDLNSVLPTKQHLIHFFIMHLHPWVAHCRNLGLHHRSAHAVVARDPGTAAHDHSGRGWSSGKGAQKEEEPQRRRGRFGDESASSQGLRCLTNQRDRWEEDGKGWRWRWCQWFIIFLEWWVFFFRTCWNVFVDVLFFKVTNSSVL